MEHFRSHHIHTLIAPAASAKNSVINAITRLKLIFLSFLWFSAARRA